MSEFGNGSDQEKIDLYAEIAALKLIVKELVHLAGEDHLKELKMRVGGESVHELLAPHGSEAISIKMKAQRIAKSLIDRVKWEKNNI
ncbi:hypothetical protein HF650_06335 [Kosakonia sp. SMBL-WEM22]|uniref:hypothetical protein n=1 Tax=Kosakonia sp. SMBL-WEM22 TaxID=2725560 RepID=UPI00165941DF|nr:hypothetical protein [Kosakonia sp. SMBL-WEM22]QNQ19403.1 hypothetical protein HF650_06335 [Kosakonia sp. SMBL-WEM22]